MLMPNGKMSNGTYGRLAKNTLKNLKKNPIAGQKIPKLKLQPAETLFGFEYSAFSVESKLIVLAMVVLGTFHVRRILLACQKEHFNNRSLQILLFNLTWGFVLVSFLGFVLYISALRIALGSTDIYCQVTNYIKHLCENIQILSTFSVVLEWLQSLDKLKALRLSYINWKYMLIFIWIVSYVLSLPYAFTSIFKLSVPKGHLQNSPNMESSDSICIRIPLFDSKLFDLVAEFLRFVCLDIIFTICLTSALIVKITDMRDKFRRQLRVNLNSEANRIEIFKMIQAVLFLVVWNMSGIMRVVTTYQIWYAPETLVDMEIPRDIIRGLTIWYYAVDSVVLTQNIRKTERDDSMYCLGNMARFQISLRNHLNYLKAIHSGDRVAQMEEIAMQSTSRAGLPSIPISRTRPIEMGEFSSSDEDHNGNVKLGVLEVEVHE